MDTYPPPHTKFGVWGWGSNPEKSSLSTKFKGPFNGRVRTCVSIIFIPINKIRPLSYYLDNCIPPHRYFRVVGRVSIHIYKEHLKSTQKNFRGFNEEYYNMNKKSDLCLIVWILTHPHTEIYCQGW